MKRSIILIMFPFVLFGEMILYNTEARVTEKKLEVTEKEIESLIDQSKEWKEQLKSGGSLKLEDIEGQDGFLYGRKLPTFLVPSREIEVVEDPLERAKRVDSYRIEEEYKEIVETEKTVHIAEFYKFLATYGMKPRENGDLPKERELYQLMKSGKVKVSSKIVNREPEKEKKKIVKYMSGSKE